jgi:protein phosphatase
LQEANRVVNQASQADPGRKGMGATAVAAVVWNGSVLLAHVGDCRAYHFHAGELRQITTDQTVVARMIELGYLSSEQAASHPARNEVTQAVGRHGSLHPDLKQFRLAPGDWLLLACDGLQAHMSTAELQDEITMLDVPAPMLARTLVDRADAAGGSDNCTVIAVCCQSPPSPSEE